MDSVVESITKDDTIEQLRGFDVSKVKYRVENLKVKVP